MTYRYSCIVSQYWVQWWPTIIDSVHMLLQIFVATGNYKMATFVCIRSVCFHLSTSIWYCFMRCSYATRSVKLAPTVRSGLAGLPWWQRENQSLKLSMASWNTYIIVVKVYCQNPSAVNCMTKESTGEIMKSITFPGINEQISIWSMNRWNHPPTVGFKQHGMQT